MPIYLGNKKILNNQVRLYANKVTIDGSPRSKFDTLDALNTAYPNGDKVPYLVGNNAYLWNGTAWEDCGVYQNSEDINKLKETLEDLSSGTKNIFDPQYLVSSGGCTKNDNVYNGKASDLHKAFGSNSYPISFDDTSVFYTVSFYAKTDANQGENGTGLTFALINENGSRLPLAIPNNTKEWTKFSVCTRVFGSTPTKISKLNITYGGYGSNIWYMKDIQVEVGEVVTEYEPCFTAKDIIARQNINLINDTLELINNSLIDLKDIKREIYGEIKLDWITGDAEFTSIGRKIYKRTIGVDARRIVNPDGKSITLNKGDTISLSNYSDARFYVSGYSDGLYFAKGWLTTDYIVPKDGDYSILVAHLDNRLIESIEELSSLVNVSVKNIKDEIEGITNKSYSLYPLPKYWSDYLENKIDTINDTIDIVGNNGDSFIFFTDYHVENNAGYSPNAIREILKNTSINKVFFGGDAFNGNASKSVAVGYLRKLVSQFDLLDFYGVRGNHDINTADGGSQAVSISDAQLYNYFIKKQENQVTNVYGLNYCIDNHTSKIRYICVNTRDAGNSTILSDDNIAWIKSRITELESGWSVLLISHGLFNFATVKGLVTTDLGYFGFGQQLVDAINSVYDNANADIIGILCGHCHYDYSKTETKGYICFSTTCDTRQEWGGLNRDLGSVNEQAFDIVSINTSTKTVKTIRVGAGVDRVLTYE